MSRCRSLTAFLRLPGELLFLSALCGAGSLEGCFRPPTLAVSGWSWKPTFVTSWRRTADSQRLFNKGRLQPPLVGRSLRKVTLLSKEQNTTPDQGRGGAATRPPDPAPLDTFDAEGAPFPASPWSDPRPLHSQVQGYLERGWFMVPLNGVHADGTCRCRLGRGCTNAGKHPIGQIVRHGSKEASRYPPAVARWYRRFPDANTGIVCGPSGVVVIDVDPRHGGTASLAALLDRHGPLPPTLTASTGGGGWHHVFADPHRQAKSTTPLPGVDILARGKLFVVDPSGHRSGGTYSWVDWSVPVAQAPSWLMGSDDR